MRSGSQRWPRGQGTRPHTEPGTNWRRHRLQRTPAARTELQPGIRTGEMRPEPMSSRRTLLINALHSPSRQILHVASPSGRRWRSRTRRASEAAKMPDCDARSQWCQEQTTQDIGVRLQPCGFPVKLQRLRLRVGIDQFPSLSREVSPSGQTY